MRLSKEVILPGGIWVDDERHQEVSLQAPTGEDEAFLHDTAGRLPPVWRAAALLERCLTRLGPYQPVEARHVLDLTVGDREALLLHLRRLTFGEHIQSVLHCPNQSCAEPMDLDLSVGDLLQTSYCDAEPFYRKKMAANGSVYQVQFRLPTGADQLAVVDIAGQEPEAVSNALIRRCVKAIYQEGHEDRPLEKWPIEIGESISKTMAELDPQAEITLNLKCPICGRLFSTLFDAASYLFQELSNRIENIYHEVHLLAFHYHWSEAEILGMTAVRRHRYLELLVDELGRG
ncbi:MAG: hypothetical protein GTO18_12365 [Anaerolineales bacterium]|nr:hypothetical protein [Anaerolineales bacterium]